MSEVLQVPALKGHYQILVFIRIFDVHGSVHRNKNLIEKNQQDATV
jgi:hypothetical protein